MERETLKATFRAIKKVAKLDYAITNVDRLGDCQSCVNYTLSTKYGEESKGIWAKHWVHGMNGSGEQIEDLDHIYIAHDLTEEQAELLYAVCSINYNVLPKKYDPFKCFDLYEKGITVYEVSCILKETGKRATYHYTDLSEAKRWAKELKSDGYEGVRIEKVF